MLSCVVSHNNAICRKGFIKRLTHSTDDISSSKPTTSFLISNPIRPAYGTFTRGVALRAVKVRTSRPLGHRFCFSIAAGVVAAKAVGIHMALPFHTALSINLRPVVRKDRRQSHDTSLKMRSMMCVPCQSFFQRSYREDQVPKADLLFGTPHRSDDRQHGACQVGCMSATSP